MTKKARFWGRSKVYGKKPFWEWTPEETEIAKAENERDKDRFIVLGALTLLLGALLLKWLF